MKAEFLLVRSVNHTSTYKLFLSAGPSVSLTLLLGVFSAAHSDLWLLMPQVSSAFTVTDGRGSSQLHSPVSERDRWICGSEREEESVPEERLFQPWAKVKLQLQLQWDMSTNSSVDNCLTPNNATYQVFSWLMAGEFILGLPLNLSVLFVFIFR